MEEFIIGRNSVRELLRSESQIEKILVAQGATEGSIKELIALAKQRKVRIQEVPRAKLDELCSTFAEHSNHQGVLAQVPAFEYSQMEDVFARAQEREEPPFLVVLDSVQDPHNLGAVIRSAEALGAHGVVFGKHRSASLTAAVYKVACGAAQYIPVVKVTNINQTIEELKKRNVWVAAADMEGQPLSKTDLTGALALVIGGEGEGVSKHTKQLCDFTVRIEMPGQTNSLNASCAASILIYEKRRQEMCR